MCWKVSMVKTTVLFTCDQLLGALIHFNFIILILICFCLMSGVNYVIYGCSCARATAEISLFRSFLTLEENIIAVITQNREIDDNLERQVKNQTLCTFSIYQQLVKIILAFFHPLCSITIQVASYIASQLEYIFFMANNFSVDYLGSYINWANNYVFIILGKLPTLNLPIKSHPSLKLVSAIFYQIFVFSPNDSPSKSMKNVFYFI